MCLEKLVKNSADVYHSILTMNNKGIISYDIKQIEKLTLEDISSNLFRFEMSSKINTSDDLQIKISNKIFPKSTIKIMMFDEDNKQLIIYLSDEILFEYNDIENMNCEDIKLIYDLKFLVKRVSEWFDCYKIQNLSNKSLTFKDVNDVKIFNNCSKEQSDAVKLALTSPISYIWGAPGTGKTQYVLTNAILNYTKLNKKVIVVAPTNNAIEQVLSSIIKMADNLSIARNKIIRLGTPTKQFFERYSEVCENHNLKKIISILFDKQNFYQGLLKHKHLKTIFPEISKQILKRIKEELEIKLFNEDLLNKNRILNENILLYHKRINLLLVIYENILVDKQLFFKKKKSLKIQIKKIFNNKLKQNLYEVENKLLNKEENTLKKIEKYNELILKNRHQISLNLSNMKVNNLSDIKDYLSQLEIPVSILNNEKIEIVKQKIEEDIKLIKDKIIQNDIIYKEYINDNENDIKEKLNKVSSEIKNKTPKNTQTRIDDALILGMTLDTFISTQLPNDDTNENVKHSLKFNANHIFFR